MKDFFIICIVPKCCMFQSFSFSHFIFPSPGVNSVPVITCLQSTQNVKPLLDHLVEESSKLDLRKYHKFLDSGLEEDEYRESVENLKLLGQCYESSSDMT